MSEPVKSVKSRVQEMSAGKQQAQPNQQTVASAGNEQACLAVQKIGAKSVGIGRELGRQIIETGVVQGLNDVYEVLGTGELENFDFLSGLSFVPNEQVAVLPISRMFKSAKLFGDGS